MKNSPSILFLDTSSSRSTRLDYYEYLFFFSKKKNKYSITSNTRTNTGT